MAFGPCLENQWPNTLANSLKCGNYSKDIIELFCLISLKTWISRLRKESCLQKIPPDTPWWVGKMAKPAKKNLMPLNKDEQTKAMRLSWYQQFYCQEEVMVNYHWLNFYCVSWSWIQPCEIFRWAEVCIPPLVWRWKVYKEIFLTLDIDSVKVLHVYQLQFEVSLITVLLLSIPTSYPQYLTAIFWKK